jgi:hypothetical protein
MRPFTQKHRLFALITVLILVSLACGIGGSAGGGSDDTPDFDGTAAALEKTAEAISSSQNEPTQAPVDDSSDDGGSDAGGECVDSAANYSAGEIVISTEFDDAPCWGTFQIPGSDDPDVPDYDLSIYNSTLFFEIYDGGISAYATYDPILDFGDVLVGAGVNTVGGPNTNNISLICRGSDVGWYEFSMTSGGEWIIWKVDATQDTIGNMYEALDSGFSNHYLRHKYNEIGISCIGDTLNFYITQIDGEVKLVGSVSDRTYREGQVAIAVYSYPTSSVNWNYGTEPMGVEFDWLEIQIP